MSRTFPQLSSQFQNQRKGECEVDNTHQLSKTTVIVPKCSGNKFNLDRKPSGIIDLVPCENIRWRSADVLRLAEMAGMSEMGWIVQIVEDDWMDRSSWHEEIPHISEVFIPFYRVKLFSHSFRRYADFTQYAHAYMLCLAWHASGQRRCGMFPLVFFLGNLEGRGMKGKSLQSAHCGS